MYKFVASSGSEAKYLSDRSGTGVKESIMSLNARVY